MKQCSSLHMFIYSIERKKRALSGKRGREIKQMRERDGRGKGGRIIQKVNSLENGILTQKRGIANFLGVDKNLKWVI